MDTSVSFDRINGKRIALKVVFFALISGFVWFYRPFFHPVFYRAMYAPGWTIAIGGGLITLVAFYFYPPVGVENLEGFFSRLGGSIISKATIFGMVFGLLLITGLFYGLVAGEFEERNLAQQAMDDVEDIEDFPKANSENPRIAPRAVSDTQTEGSVSYQQYELGPSDIARTEDGRLAWSYPIQADQLANRWSGEQNGIMISDMTTMEDREMTAYDDDEHNFRYGQNQLFRSSTDWQLKYGDYHAQYRDDPVEFSTGDDVYMAYPKTGHEWQNVGLSVPGTDWELPIPTGLPYTTPTWEGVAVVHTDGTINHHSPEEAQESEILDGQRLYPLYNSQRIAESVQYRNGIINQMWFAFNEEAFVPASMPSGAGNSQPFVVDMEGQQMMYLFAMEPPDGDQGLGEIWFFNADTGEMEYYQTGDETLFGPERAMGLVRSEDSRTGWAEGSEGGNFRVVEPIATFIDDELWWHSKVVPIDNTDVSRNAFVNAHNGEVVELHNTEAVVEFMSGEEVEDIDDTEVDLEEGDEDDEAELYIVISEDGEEVDRIPVEEGQDVELELDTENDENDD